MHAHYTVHDLLQQCIGQLTVHYNQSLDVSKIPNATGQLVDCLIIHVTSRQGKSLQKW